MADDATRTAFEIALQVALRDQARANATVEFLREKLGLAEAARIVIGIGDAEPDDSPREVGPVQVTDAEFFGMSQTKAAALFLERAGRSRPQRTEAIIAALRKGGVRFEGKDPTQTFYSILHRTPAFRRVGKGLWGLSAWYPEPGRKARSESNGQSDISAAGSPSDINEGVEPEEA